MEALVAILIEAILAPLFALFGVMASLLAGVISSLFTVIVNVVMAFLTPKGGAVTTSPVRVPSDAPTVSRGMEPLILLQRLLVRQLGASVRVGSVG